jgi:hypothetical protein
MMLLVCFCVSPFHFLSQLTDFDEDWYERYAIYCPPQRHTILFPTSSDKNMEDRELLGWERLSTFNFGFCYGV